MVKYISVKNRILEVEFMDITMCAEVFLKEQTKLFDEPVAETVEEAEEFLEDVFAQEFDSLEDIREYWKEEGVDVEGMSIEDIEESLEVFKLPNGKFLVVEA